MKLRETAKTIREIPQQIKATVSLAVSALIVAFIALAMVIVVGRRAN